MCAVRIKPPEIKDNDWNSVRQAVHILAKKLGLTGSPTFTGLNLSGLTASRLIASDGSNNLISSDLNNWVTGTTNQITVADDSDGTITLSTPQDIHTGASPTFVDLTLSSPSNIYSLSHDSFADVHQDVNTDASPTFDGLTSTSTIDASAGEVLTQDNDTSEPSGKSDGYVGVATVVGNARIYFAIDGKMYYIDGTEVAAAEIETGNPIGLLLALTYNIP